MNVIIWGIGERFEFIYRHTKDCTSNKIIALIDSSPEKQGEIVGDLVVENPDNITNKIFDVVLISSEKYFCEIRQELINKYGVTENKIKHGTFFLAEDIVLYYAENKDDEVQQVINWIKKHRMVREFNYDFVEKHNYKDVICEFDINNNLFFVMHNGKRLYFKKSFKTKEQVKYYYNSLLIEQDENSPHKYLCDRFSISNGDVVIDAGAAEGFFSLDVIESASHVFLIESDDSWNEALMETFRHYANKITIINKYLNSYSDSNNITIDEIGKKSRVNVIKMDIEGFEKDALLGGEKTIYREKPKMAICTYHNYNDASLIIDILTRMNIKSTNSKGYMVYAKKGLNYERLVRGMVYAW